jgi:toxin ParE1/3/4
MALIFHRLVQKDVRAVLRYYEEEGGVLLADRFFLELDTLVADVAREPRRFHPALHGLRRANMPTFPYHLLFREVSAGVRVLVLRHHKRRPRFGVGRK